MLLPSTSLAVSASIAALSFDPTNFAEGAVAGAIVIAVSVYFGVIRRRRVAPAERGEFEFPVSATPKMVNKAEIEAARRELKLLKMEKDYLSRALAGFYEAETRGLINKEERVTLSQKYRIQLKEVEEKISRAQMLVDVSDLEDARSELLSLVNQKITQIDSRLSDLKEKIAPLLPQSELARPVEPLTEKKEKVEELPKKPEIMDDRLKKVVQDVNEVMAKLEQMDLEE
jgi:hypothetical protein